MPRKHIAFFSVLRCLQSFNQDAASQPGEFSDDGSECKACSSGRAPNRAQGATACYRRGPPPPPHASPPPTPPPPPPPPPPDHVSQSDDGQLFTFFDAPATWYDAEANCDKLGGHLATVTSAAEQQQVEDLTKAAGAGTVWIGLVSTVSHLQRLALLLH